MLWYCMYVITVFIDDVLQIKNSIEEDDDDDDDDYDDEIIYLR